MKTELCLLAEKYGCDKTPAIRHGYTPFYHSILRNRTIKRVFEIGVAGGASMKMWHDYFPEAVIFGIDNDPGNIIQSDRIYTTLCDASNSTDLHDVASAIGGNFDLIVDDGSHFPQHQISAFHTLLPFLTDDGIYVIEDVLHIETVSNQIAFPHEIHRFDPHSQFGDDNLIVYFKENTQWSALF